MRHRLDGTRFMALASKANAWRFQSATGIEWVLVESLASEAIKVRSGNLRNIASARLEKIRAAKITPEDLSTPSKDLIKLPFPGVSLFPMDRFEFGAGEIWQYMPREIFSELLEKVKVFMKEKWTAFWLYGTIGFGKSHVLAALVCYLMQSGYRVIYIPDCRACYESPVPILRQAMILAWADLPSMVTAIESFDTLDEICGFLEGFSMSDQQPFFVADQMNALQVSSRNSQETRQIEDLYGFIQKCAPFCKRIFSTSANNHTYLQLAPKQANILRVNAYGGMTKVTIACI